MTVYSEGIAFDGVAILKDGQPMPVEDIVKTLNNQLGLNHYMCTEINNALKMDIVPPSDTVSRVRALVKIAYES